MGVSDDVIGRSMEFRYDADNTVWAYIYAENDCVAKTPIKMELYELGWRTLDLADDTETFYVAVPKDAIATGAYGWVQIGGPVDAVITKSMSVAIGNAIGVEDGTATDLGADYAGQSAAWAIARVAGTTSTCYQLWLTCREVLQA
jgi:hypothetical protein